MSIILMFFSRHTFRQVLIECGQNDNRQNANDFLVFCPYLFCHLVFCLAQFFLYSVRTISFVNNFTRPDYQDGNFVIIFNHKKVQCICINIIKGLVPFTQLVKVRRGKLVPIFMELLPDHLWH